MPPARTPQRTRRRGGDAFQANWTASVESATPQTFSFAPNVTPVTFVAPEPVVELSEESQWFPSTTSDGEETLLPRKTNHNRRRGANYPPRPPNAFILFRSSFIRSQHVSAQIEGNRGTLSKIVGLLWHNLPYEERRAWQAKAKRVLEEHKKRFPDFSFKTPTKTKDTAAGGSTAGAKRRVHNMGPRDFARCEKIASLLSSGMKGSELEAAIAEFDRTRVVEYQTQFEAPITARQYRRSSSAPAPPTDKSKADGAFMPASRPNKRRRRSSSITGADAPALLINTAMAGGYAPSSAEVSPTSAAPSFAGDYESDSSVDFNNFSFSSECATPSSADSYGPMDFPYSSSLTQEELDAYFNQSLEVDPTAACDFSMFPESPALQTPVDTWSNPQALPYTGTLESLPMTPSFLGNGLPSEYISYQPLGDNSQGGSYESTVCAGYQTQPDQATFYQYSPPSTQQEVSQQPSIQLDGYQQFVPAVQQQQDPQTCHFDVSQPYTDYQYTAPIGTVPDPAYDIGASLDDFQFDFGKSTFDAADLHQFITSIPAY